MARASKKDGWEAMAADALLPYLATPDPLDLFIPRLGFRRCHRYPEVEQILAGGTHDPVVYFARAGRKIKIGTSTNLRVRMRALYLDLDDVLAVVPGGRAVEAAYHWRFGRSHIQVDDRSELYGLDIWLRMYLARCRCSWAEALGAFGIGQASALATGSLILGVLTFAAIVLTLLVRPGWDWRRISKRRTGGEHDD